MGSLKHQTISGNKKTLVALTVILLAGLFFRLYNLAAESLWLDEINTLQLAKQSMPALIEIFWFRGGDANPPLYYVFLHFWVRLFGTSEFAVRFPSVVFGILGILAIYKLGALIFDEEAGILSALFMSLSVFHVSYSQEARMYALFVLSALLSFYFLVRMIRGNGKAAPVLYVLTTSLLIYCHVYSLFIVLAQNVFFLSFLAVSKERHALNLKRWIFLQLVLVLLFLPWIRPLLKGIDMVHRGFWIVKPTLNTLKKTFIGYTDSIKLSLLFMGLALFALLPHRSVRKTLRKEAGLANSSCLYLLTLWLLVPVLLPFLVSLVTTPIYTSRYTIVALPAFYLLAARGITKLSHRVWKIILVSLIITSCLLNISDYFATTKKEQWREVAAFVDSHAKQGDLILFNDERDHMLPDCFGHYSKNTNQTLKGVFTKEMLALPKTGEDELLKMTGGSQRAWVILSHCIMMDEGLITERFGALFGKPLHHRFKGVDLYLYERQPTRYSRPDS